MTALPDFLPLVLIFICMVAGIVLFTPEARARLLLMRGDEKGACIIWEGLLERNPEKLSLYRKLAKIYYIENRRDKRALKAFELILKLKIPFEWRDDLYTIMAKHYIVEGRKDSEAIRIIEKAVSKEMKKLVDDA